MPPTTELLLGHVARGDTAAFESVYDRLSGVVFGVVLQVVRDAAQSEEVAQEVMVEVWRIAARFDPARDSARSWVLTMARGRAIDRVRSAPELQRESVTLACYRWHTQAEIAALLGSPLGTVKTRMRDGLIRLRDGLG